MKTRLIAVLIPALATMAFAAPAVADTSGPSSEAVSENWAGYEATTTTSSGFSAASGSWVEPSVSCTDGQTYSAYWVGLGGGDSGSTALEQEGTQADCSSTGQATYYAWYELVPSAPVKIDLTIHAGDRMWARTAVSGDQVTVTVEDKTTGQDFTKTLTMSSTAPDTSTAEWVAEAPSECEGGAQGECEPLPLSDFGTVKFTNAYATAGGQTKSISGWNDQAIALSPSAGSDYGYGGGYGGGFGDTYGGGGFGGGGGSSASDNSEGAAPGALSSDGTQFTVTYGAASSAADSTGAAGDGNSAGYGDSGYGAGYGYGDSGYGYGGSGYGDSAAGYGDSGYGYGYGYGDSGYGYGESDPGYGYYSFSPGGGYGESYTISPYDATGSDSLSEAYYGDGTGTAYGY